MTTKKSKTYPKSQPVAPIPLYNTEEVGGLFNMYRKWKKRSAVPCVRIQSSLTVVQRQVIGNRFSKLESQNLALGGTSRQNLMLIAVLLVIDSSWSQSGTEKSLSNHIAVIFFYGWHKKEGNNRIGTRHKSRAKAYLYCL